METEVAISTETIEIAVFYKNTFPMALDTTENVKCGKWARVHPKWWDGILHVKDVPLTAWNNGTVTIENIENYM